MNHTHALNAKTFLMVPLQNVTDSIKSYFMNIAKRMVRIKYTPNGFVLRLIPKILSESTCSITV